MFERGPEIERTQLLEAADQEGQLRLEGGAGFAFVESLQERIVFGLDDSLGGEPLSKNPGQRALADAYGTFDRNITGKFEKIGHERL